MRWSYLFPFQPLRQVPGQLDIATAVLCFCIARGLTPVAPIVVSMVAAASPQGVHLTRETAPNYRRCKQLTLGNGGCLGALALGVLPVAVK
jgi:hypothetical protein